MAFKIRLYRGPFHKCITAADDKYTTRQFVQRVSTRTVLNGNDMTPWKISIFSTISDITGKNRQNIEGIVTLEYCVSSTTINTS